MNARPIPAIVESTLAPQLAAVRSAVSALRDAEAQETKADQRLSAARADAERRRLALGKALLAARKAWPASGPNARGWGEFLAREGIEERSAQRYMLAAGATEQEAGGRPRPDPSEQPDPAGARGEPEFPDSKPQLSENLTAQTDAAPSPDRDAWCTPRAIALAIGEVDLDPCSNERSHILAAQAFRLDRGEDGLACAAGVAPGVKVYCNPPYSDVRPWVDAYAHTRFVFLLKFDPSTRWFAALIEHTELVLWPRGTRVQFEAPPGVDAGSANPFPHALFFARAEDASDAIRAMCWAWRVR